MAGVQEILPLGKHPKVSAFIFSRFGTSPQRSRQRIPPQQPPQHFKALPDTEFNHVLLDHSFGMGLKFWCESGTSRSLREQSALQPVSLRPAVLGKLPVL